MKVLSVTVALTLAAGFIQMAVGLKCGSDCAACWKIGSPGVDIKIGCHVDTDDCGQACPAGYENLHCAKWQRCACKTGQTCTDFGPCACGTRDSADQWTSILRKRVLEEERWDSKREEENKGRKGRAPRRSGGLSGLVIGHGLESCTAGIQEVDVQIDEKIMTLIDTPGFDDTTNKTDAEGSEGDRKRSRNQTFMVFSYRRDRRLTGVIFLHRTAWVLATKMF